MLKEMFSLTRNEPKRFFASVVAIALPIFTGLAAFLLVGLLPQAAEILRIMAESAALARDALSAPQLSYRTPWIVLLGGAWLLGIWSWYLGLWLLRIHAN